MDQSRNARYIERFVDKDAMKAEYVAPPG